MCPAAVLISFFQPVIFFFIVVPHDKVHDYFTSSWKEGDADGDLPVRRFL